MVAKFQSRQMPYIILGQFENIKHTHQYNIYEEELDHVFAEKDLGVIIDSELKFEEHMSMKITKANSIVDLIWCCFSFLDCNLF